MKECVRCNENITHSVFYHGPFDETVCEHCYFDILQSRNYNPKYDQVCDYVDVAVLD